MGGLLLTWFTVFIFVLMMFWGFNIPTERRSLGVTWMVALIILFNIIFQTPFFQSDSGVSSSSQTHKLMAESQVHLGGYLDNIALRPGSLHALPYKSWYRILTSSFIHYGWLNLIYNLWFFVLFGHILERIWGLRKFAVVALAGLIIPPLLDGLIQFPGIKTSGYIGGLSGLIYACMGACLVTFPRSRVYAAVNYDLRYWAAVFFIILPVTMIARFAGLAFTEIVIICGMLGVFLLIQPEHVRFSFPIAAVIAYKIFQDIFLIQPVVGQIITNSPWRMIGGFVIGGGIGLTFCGISGWKKHWDDDTKPGKLKPGSRHRIPLAKQEEAASRDIDDARHFLGQRVFIGDATRVAQFYTKVVIPKFPDLALPLQEQMALARLLHFKGNDSAALHAYEILLRTKPLPDEYWMAWLKAAELIITLAPERRARAKSYLKTFINGDRILMRDRIEAERLLEDISSVSDAANPSPIISAAEDAAISSFQSISQIYEEPDSDNNEQPDEREYGRPTLRKKRRKNSAGFSKLEMPRRTPKTFAYNSDGIPIMMSDAENDDKDNQKQTPVEDTHTYWHPIPYISDRKISEDSLLELKVRNPRYVDESTSSNMYGAVVTSDENSNPGQGHGRLSRLELMHNEIKSHIPKTSEIHGNYSENRPGENTRIDTSTRFRLRGEKELPPRRATGRASVYEPKSIVENWKEPLKPTTNIPGESKEYGLDKQDEPSNDD